MQICARKDFIAFVSRMAFPFLIASSSAYHLLVAREADNVSPATGDWRPPLNLPKSLAIE